MSTTRIVDTISPKANKKRNKRLHSTVDPNSDLGVMTPNSKRQKQAEPTSATPNNKPKFANNTFYMRGDRRKAFEDENGQIVPLKKAAAIDMKKITAAYHTAQASITDEDMTESTLEKTFEFIYESGIETTPTKRAINRLEYGSNGSPLAAITPGNSRLPLGEKLGPLYIFNNLPNGMASSIKPNFSMDEFKQTETFQSVKKILDEVKAQELLITKPLIEKTKLSNKANKKKRDQNAVMREDGYSSDYASANKYASELTKTYEAENIRWEWLHLIAYMILGLKSQDDENLVCGTGPANTEMIFVENELGFLAETYPEGFKLQVSAELIPGTHLASKIHYFITTSDFSCQIDFNSLQANKPLASTQEYVHALFTALSQSRKQPFSELETQQLPQRKNLIFFFNETKSDQSQAATSAPTKPNVGHWPVSPIKKV